MSVAPALLGVVAALLGGPPAAQPAAAPVTGHAGGPLEVRADGKVFSLERPAETMAGDAKAGPAVVERVDLVWGCRGDRRRALLLEGEQRPGVAPPDACVVRIDVRPPCPPVVDDAGLADDDARALAAAVAERHLAAMAAHHQRMAWLGAGFSQWGPGLRVVVTGGGALRITSSRLALDSCGCDGSTARALGDETTTVMLPKVAGPTVVWLPVARYLGSLHRLGAGKAGGSASLSFTDPFQAEDDGDDEALDGAGPSALAFSAPSGCDCLPCED